MLTWGQIFKSVFLNALQNLTQSDIESDLGMISYFCVSELPYKKPQNLVVVCMGIVI